MKKTILVTGAAGFIGSALVKRFLEIGHDVIGIDSLNNYYDPQLKQARLNELSNYSSGKIWRFYKTQIEDKDLLSKIFTQHKPQIVVNLAAQAGVRYSLVNPSAYIQANIVGFSYILEECRNNKVEHLVYASSSSVYGGNQALPFHEKQQVNHPVSLYAATKKSNELMAHTYSHLYNLPATGLRFFTVYGPWGRPDMAPMLFAKAILTGKPIKIFNFGNMQRDFTYIDDIVEGIFRCCFKVATKDIHFDSLKPDPSTSTAPHRIFNIGNNQPIQLLQFIDLLEKSLGKVALKEFHPIQPGDVMATFADTSALRDWIGFSPSTPIEQGISDFAKWYLSYYKFDS